MGRSHALSPTAKVRVLDLLGYSESDRLNDGVDSQAHSSLNAKEGSAEIETSPSEKTLGRSFAAHTDQAIHQIEMAVGIYVHSRQHLDELPRPADYLATFNLLRSDTLVLLQKLGRLDYCYLDLFALNGANYYEIQTKLFELFIVCNSVNAGLKGKSSKGPKKELAKLYVLSRLQEIYQKYRRSNAFTSHFDFVKAVMLDSKIMTMPPATPDKPAEQREIDFDKELKRLLLRTTKTPVAGLVQF